MPATTNTVNETTTPVLLLQRLTERLASPDLTAAEANMLRPRLLGLLEALADDLTVAVTPERRSVA